jgi:serine/threonine protein kinase/tetratricopeptide (TPR) repeat protein
MTEETLFQEALCRAPAERAAFLEQACAGRPELRAAVEALLAAHEKSGNVLDRPPAEVGPTVDSGPGEPDPGATGAHTPQPAAAPGAGRGSADPVQLTTTADYRPDAQPGAVIAGRYTLVEKIGEGGMGEVWVAKQTEPVKRKVALKLIKTGMDSKAVLQRFEAERQALALMDHPNSARVLDGGLTPTGQPFFVMELVHGLPLTRFCDEARLGIRERLELFTPVCQAVQHAHQKGIVHRDLKPANILVTLIDGKGVPKVIDFGVAKATSGKLTDESLSTQFGAVVGTLEYMAPEQAGYAGADIDTRADIYSLGVILYELLTGLRPLDARRLRKAALTEMIRIIQEEEPSKPSTRLSTGEALPSLAALRQTEPKKLMALLRGELDWVVMKCLEKQRDRRYETANALGRDVQRYLADEPVEARPPSAGYRLGKFLRRNKGKVIAASLVLFVLLAGTVGTTLGLLEARRSAEAERLAKVDAQEKQTLAEQNETKAVAAAERERAAKTDADVRRREAETNLAFATKGNAILGSVFERLDPKANYGTVAELRNALRDNLNKAVKELEGSAIGDPLTVAAMQNRLGRSLIGLGEADAAITILEKATATYKARFGSDSFFTLVCMNDLAFAYHHTGKLNLALPLFEETLGRCNAVFAPDNPQRLAVMTNLACAYQDAGKRDLALPLFEETLRLTKAKLGPDHHHTLIVMNGFARAYVGGKKPDLALPLYEEVLKLQKAKFGADNPATLRSMHGLADAYRAAGKLDLALPLFEETLKLLRAKLGGDNPETLACMGNLGRAYRVAGKVNLALPLFEKTLKPMRDKFGPEHPTTLKLCANRQRIAYS